MAVIDAIDGDRAARELHGTEEGDGEARLACTRTAHYPHALARRNAERERREDRLVGGGVLKAHVAELDGAVRGPRGGEHGSAMSAARMIGLFRGLRAGIVWRRIILFSR